MRLARVELQNWRCFRGEHAADLGPGAHAVVARHERDAERSNWLGKSSFHWAIRFLMTGERPEDCRTEDDWITRGEPSGSVAGILDDGTQIERSRSRGASTLLTVKEPSQDKPSRKAEAQQAIDRILGLSPDDAPVWFFAQKTMDRLVRARPAERAAEVAGWLRMDKLVTAEAKLRARLSALVDRENEAARDLKRDEDALADLVRRFGIATDNGLASSQNGGERRATGGSGRGSADSELRDDLRADRRGARPGEETIGRDAEAVVRSLSLHEGGDALAHGRGAGSGGEEGRAIDRPGSRRGDPRGDEGDRSRVRLQDPTPIIAELDRRIADAEDRLRYIDVTRVRLEQEAREAAAHHADEARRREREELRREAEQAEQEARQAEERAPSKTRLVRLRAAAEGAAGAARTASDKSRDKRTLARGGFDGSCPVGGVRCPIADTLNARAEENAAAAHEASVDALGAKERAEEARRALDAAEGRRRAAETARARADALRARVERTG